MYIKLKSSKGLTFLIYTYCDFLSIGKWRKIANSFIVKMRIDMARVIRDEDGETNNNFSMLKSRDCTFVGFLIQKKQILTENTGNFLQ